MNESKKKCIYIKKKKPDGYIVYIYILDECNQRINNNEKKFKILFFVVLLLLFIKVQMKVVF